MFEAYQTIGPQIGLEFRTILTYEVRTGDLFRQESNDSARVDHVVRHDQMDHQSSSSGQSNSSREALQLLVMFRHRLQVLDPLTEQRHRPFVDL